jgi:hypothetical protein
MMIWALWSFLTVPWVERGVDDGVVSQEKDDLCHIRGYACLFVCLILIRHMGRVETSRLCVTCHSVQ